MHVRFSMLINEIMDCSYSIPKIIHLVWFGNREYPELIQKCIRSWKDILPDYEIKIWDESSVSNIKIPWLQESLSKKKYAFASDVVRAYALYHFGGVYMDTDVFLKRRFDDFLCHTFVSFVEYYPDYFDKSRIEIDGSKKLGLEFVRYLAINITFMASIKGHEYMRMVLEEYKKRNFIKEDGSFQFIIGEDLYSLVAEQFGFKYKDETQNLNNDICIFESKYYSHNDDVSFGVHCYAQSWVNDCIGKKEILCRYIKSKVKVVLSFFDLYKKDWRHLKYDGE